MNVSTHDKSEMVAAAVVARSQLKSRSEFMSSEISTEMPTFESFDESRYTHLPLMNDANSRWCTQKQYFLSLLKRRADMILSYGTSKQKITNSGAEDIHVFCNKLNSISRNLVGFAKEHPIAPGTPDNRLKTYFDELEEELRRIGTKAVGQRFERWLFEQFEPLKNKHGIV
tara:strand:+ start:2457 stop:2969 length:513 start_codon:yes stop_codon:yes gene_type:complete